MPGSHPDQRKQVNSSPHLKANIVVALTFAICIWLYIETKVSGKIFI
jgi:hypothetical protein